VRSLLPAVQRDLHTRPVESRITFYGEIVSYDLLVSVTAPPSMDEWPPASAVALHMASRYYRDMPEFCAGLFTARHRKDGYALNPTGWKVFDLLRVGAPTGRGTADFASVAFPVVGGLLSRRTDPPGRFAFEAVREGRRLTLLVRVIDFGPSLVGPRGNRLRKVLYRLTQSLAHRVIIGAFLLAMGRELATGRPAEQWLHCTWEQPPT